MSLQLRFSLKPIWALPLLISLFFGLTPPSLNAAVVKKVKGRNILIEDKEGALVKGEVYYLVNKKGKKKGLLKIRKIKGQRAIGRMGKGRARPGYTLRLKKRRRYVEKSRFTLEGSTIYWGGLFGYSLDSMEANIDTGSTTQATSMSGSAFSLTGLVDYKFYEQVWFRGQAGLEQFSASSGDTFCGPSSNEGCKAELSYLSFNFWGRYIFKWSDPKYRPWAGAGLHLMFPMSKSVTALENNSITNTTVWAFGAGVDWFLDRRSYIPLSIEYGLYPSSSEIKAHQITFRVGYAIPF